jgi:hypothetical protein
VAGAGGASDASAASRAIAAAIAGLLCVRFIFLLRGAGPGDRVPTERARRKPVGKIL